MAGHEYIDPPGNRGGPDALTGSSAQQSRSTPIRDDLLSLEREGAPKPLRPPRKIWNREGGIAGMLTAWRNWLDEWPPTPWLYASREAPLWMHYWARWSGTPKRIADVAMQMLRVTERHYGHCELAAMVRVRRRTPAGLDEFELEPSDFREYEATTLRGVERITIAIGRAWKGHIRPDEPELARLDLNPLREPAARLVVLDDDQDLHQELAQVVSPAKLWSAVWLSRLVVGLAVVAFVSFVVSKRWIGITHLRYRSGDWQRWAIPLGLAALAIYFCAPVMRRLLQRLLPPVDLLQTYGRRYQDATLIVAVVAAAAAIVALFGPVFAPAAGSDKAASNPSGTPATQPRTPTPTASAPPPARQRRATVPRRAG